MTYGVPVFDGSYVFCTECDVRTESYKTKTGRTWDVEAAITAWNRRAEAKSEPVARGSVLEKAQRLFLTLAAKHYPEVQNPTPFDETWAVLSQIDNVTSGLTRANTRPLLTAEQVDEIVAKACDGWSRYDVAARVIRKAFVLAGVAK